MTRVGFRRRFLLNENLTNSDIEIIHVHIHTTSNNFGARSRDLTNSETVNCIKFTIVCVDFTIVCLDFTIVCLDFTIEARSEKNPLPSVAGRVAVWPSNCEPPPAPKSVEASIS